MPDHLDIRQVGSRERYPFRGVTDAAASGACCACGKQTVETWYAKWCCYGYRKALGKVWGPGVALGREPAQRAEVGETTKVAKL